MKISEGTRKKADKVYPYVVWFCIVLFALCAVFNTVMVIMEIVSGRFDPVTTFLGVALVLIVYYEIRCDFLDGLAAWKKRGEQ